MGVAVCSDTTNYLPRELVARNGIHEPVFVSEIAPVIGAHVGPGLLGVGAVPTARVN